MRRSRALGAALALLLAVVGTAHAHEFWIEPGTFAPGVGDRVPVRLYVGDAGDRDELPRRSDHLLRFDAVGAGGVAPVVGLFGRAPAGMLKPEAAGESMLVYEGRHTFLELPAEKFESYLQAESLSRVIEERVRRNESLEPGRESYARYAKALVRVEGADDARERVYDREIGLPLEIVLETDPRSWADGDPLTVRLLYEGRPLADQQMKLIHLRDAELSLVSRTGADGRVRLLPPQAGPWLMATVYMRRAPEGVEGDWESFWGSLTLELPATAN